MKTSYVFLMKAHRGAVVAAAVLLLTACNVEDTVTVNEGEPDAGFNVEERDAEEEDVGGEDTGEPDTGEPDTGGPDSELPMEARQWCSAGGVATGEGIRLVHCTAPSTVSGPTLEGDGVRLEAGASRVIFP